MANAHKPTNQELQGMVEQLQEELITLQEQQSAQLVKV